MMAARRESDVLLTEGHDGAWAFPGPSNAAYGVFGGNPSRIGYGGWDGNAQQVATINVDNEFTDFDEPMAETVIGWKGVTIVPDSTARGTSTCRASTPTSPTTPTGRPRGRHPSAWIDTATRRSNWTRAWVTTSAARTRRSRTRRPTSRLVNGKYTLNVGKGTRRLREGEVHQGDRRSDERSEVPAVRLGWKHDPLLLEERTRPTASSTPRYPGDVTVDGVTGHQWKPFTSVEDDDRDLKYTLINVGGGYQLTSDLYGTLGVLPLQDRPERREDGLPGLSSPRDGGRQAQQEPARREVPLHPLGHGVRVSSTSTTSARTSRTSATASSFSVPRRTT